MHLFTLQISIVNMVNIAGINQKSKTKLFFYIIVIVAHDFHKSSFLLHLTVSVDSVNGQ